MRSRSAPRQAAACDSACNPSASLLDGTGLAARPREVGRERPQQGRLTSGYERWGGGRWRGARRTDRDTKRVPRRNAGRVDDGDVVVAGSEQEVKRARRAARDIATGERKPLGQ